MKRLIALALFAAIPAYADEDLCTDRGGQATDPCTQKPGKAMVESGVDWTRDVSGGQRTDTLLFGDTELRIGLAEGLEAQIEWTPYGTVRTRDRATGRVTHMGGAGDVTLALKLNPGGSDGPVAIKPYVVLPTGGSAIGQGTWSAGVLIPANIDFSDALSLGLVAEAEAAPNQSRHGRHFAYGGIAELDYVPVKDIDLLLGASAIRDDDPSGATTQVIGSLSGLWRTGEHLQLDVDALAGLNRDTPDFELLIGFSRQF